MTQTDTPLNEAKRFIRAAFGNDALQDEYVLKGTGSDDDVTAWLKSKGYETTVKHVRDEWAEEINNVLDYYQGTYNTYLKTKVGPTLRIDHGVIMLNDKEIDTPLFVRSKLTWSSSSGKNDTNGEIDFILFDADDLKMADGTEIKEDKDFFFGAQFKGRCWTTEPKPSAFNFYGRQGVFPTSFVEKILATHASPAAPAPTALPALSSSLSQWADKYTVYRISPGGGTIKTEDHLVIGTDSTVKFNDTVIKSPRWSNELLSWDASGENAFNFSVFFRRVDHVTVASPHPGNQFYGKKWAKGETIPVEGNILGLIGAGDNPVAAAKSAEVHASERSWATEMFQAALSMTLAHYMIETLNLTGRGVKAGASILWDKAKAAKAERARVQAVQRAGDRAIAREKALEKKQAADAEKAEKARLAAEELEKEKLKRELEHGKGQSSMLEAEMGEVQAEQRRRMEEEARARGGAEPEVEFDEHGQRRARPGEIDIRSPRFRK